jgi:hypothetical protein
VKERARGEPFFQDRSETEGVMAERNTDMKRLRDIARVPEQTDLPPDWIIERQEQERRRREERPALRIEAPPRVVSNTAPDAAPPPAPTSTVVVFDISTGI